MLIKVLKGLKIIEKTSFQSENAIIKCTHCQVGISILFYKQIWDMLRFKCKYNNISVKDESYVRERETDRPADRPTDQQTDRQKDRQAGRQAGRDRRRDMVQGES